MGSSCRACHPSTSANATVPLCHAPAVRPNSLSSPQQRRSFVSLHNPAHNLPFIVPFPSSTPLHLPHPQSTTKKHYPFRVIITPGRNFRTHIHYPNHSLTTLSVTIDILVKHILNHPTFHLCTLLPLYLSTLHKK
jgi:hypothetical protein